MYDQEGKKILAQLWTKNKIPFVVGGGGLYINAPLKNYQFFDQGRDLLKTKKYKSISNYALWEKLAAINPQKSTKVHHNNRKRVWRALERYS